MRPATLLLPFLLIFGTACSKKSKCPPRVVRPNELSGTWYDSRERYAFAGTLYEFHFTADSFRAVFMQWSDMVSAGPCPTDEFKEYAKGSYQLNYNTISLNGFFTDSSFNGIASGCYRTGPFHQEFKIHLECESLRLNPVGNQSPTYTIRMHR